MSPSPCILLERDSCVPINSETMLWDAVDSVPPQPRPCLRLETYWVANKDNTSADRNGLRPREGERLRDAADDVAAKFRDVQPWDTELFLANRSPPLWPPLELDESTRRKLKVGRRVKEMAFFHHVFEGNGKMTLTAVG